MSWPDGLPYYDRDGVQVSGERWAQLHSDVGYIVVRKSLVMLGDVEVTVSTVWVGLSMQYGDGPPLIFETMYFGGPRDGELVDRYPTELAALAGHDQAVAAIRDKAARK
jgi:hypothetical protein